MVILISIPKGAIMSQSRLKRAQLSNKFQFQKVRLWEVFDVTCSYINFNFNSKRCDYESVQCQQIFYCICISIPKGAIMRIQKKDFSTVKRKYFNSKRCDYEIPLNLLTHSIPHFNSKRCDYECWYVINIHRFSIFQFQKVRLWGVTKRVYKTVLMHFNSKRCDYENWEKQLKLVNNDYFISKRCDYENFAIAAKRIFPNFNSKRCDYEYP